MTDRNDVTAEGPAIRRRWLVPTAIVAAVAIVTVGAWTAVSLSAPTPGVQPVAAETPRATTPEPVAEPATEPKPEPKPTEEPTPRPTAGVSDRQLPTSCEGLFSDSMAATLTGQYRVTLNPEWSKAPNTIPLPTTDSTLSAVIAEQPALHCNWMPGGGGHTGIITVIASVDAAEAATVERRLAELYEAVDEPFGTRYIDADWDTAAGGSVGQSHLVREGLWFATRWGNIPVEGYTADMVEHVFG